MKRGESPAIGGAPPAAWGESPAVWGATPAARGEPPTKRGAPHRRGGVNTSARRCITCRRGSSPCREGSTLPGFMFARSSQEASDDPSPVRIPLSVLPQFLRRDGIPQTPRCVNRENPGFTTGRFPVRAPGFSRWATGKFPGRSLPGAFPRLLPERDRMRVERGVKSSQPGWLRYAWFGRCDDWKAKWVNSRALRRFSLVLMLSR